MKLQTRLIGLLIAGSFLAAGFTSCKKYEEGPVFSFYTKKARMANTWVVYEAYEDGENVTSAYDQYELKLTKDGDAKLVALYTSGDFTFEYETDGTWEFVNDKEDLKLDMENDDADQEYQILKLQNNEMWLREKGEDVELRLESL